MCTGKGWESGSILSQALLNGSLIREGRLSLEQQLAAMRASAIAMLLSVHTSKQAAVVANLRPFVSATATYVAELKVRKVHGVYP